MSADRDRLAAALDGHQDRYERTRRPWGDGWVLVGCTCGWQGTDRRAHRTDALLDVVQALVAEGKAAELEAAASDWEVLVQREKPPIRGSVWLLARADALEGK